MAGAVLYPLAPCLVVCLSPWRPTPRTTEHSPPQQLLGLQAPRLHQRLFAFRNMSSFVLSHWLSSSEDVSEVRATDSSGGLGFFPVARSRALVFCMRQTLRTAAHSPLPDCRLWCWPDASSGLLAAAVIRRYIVLPLRGATSPLLLSPDLLSSSSGGGAMVHAISMCAPKRVAPAQRLPRSRCESSFAPLMQGSPVMCN